MLPANPPFSKSSRTRLFSSKYNPSPAAAPNAVSPSPTPSHARNQANNLCLDRASSMFSIWVPGTALDTYSTFTTSWYTPTVNVEAVPVTLTNSYDAMRESLIAQHTKHCWISDEMWDHGLIVEDFPEACRSLINVYCFPTPGAPIPTSPGHIPAMCTPSTTQVGLPYSTPTPSGGMYKIHRLSGGNASQATASQYKTGIS